MEIQNIIDSMAQACEQYSALAEKTLLETEPERKITAMQEQSVRGYEIYHIGADALKGLNRLLSEEWDEETAEAAFQKTLDCYSEDKLDSMLLNKLCKKLLDYYEKTDNPERLILSANMLGNSYSELSHLNSKQYLKLGYEVYRRVLDFREHPCLFSDEYLAMKVTTAFYNICSVYTARDTSLIPVGWETYLLFQEWLKGDFCSRLIESFPMLKDEIRDIQDSFYGTVYTADPSFHTEEIEAYIEKQLENELSEEGKPSAEIAEVYISHLRSIARKQPERVRECYTQAVEYYESFADSGIEPVFISAFNTICLELLRELYDAVDFSPEERAEQAAYIINRMLEYFRKERTENEGSAILTETIPDLLFNQRFIDLYTTVEEKTDVIFNMFISRHISTYMHCNMAAAFSECITRWVLQKKPELFIGLEGIKTAKEAVENSERLINTVRRHALLHDIGKIGIQEVVSRQYRPITDEEFRLIRRHPEAGAEYIKDIPGLADCADTARGHHKFYNGQGGYPASFDNTASPVRLIIDIITLSDCLDAATDYMGRNYRSVKSAAQVIEEFRDGAGVLYNPELVGLMDEEKMTEELESIAGPERKRIFTESCRSSTIE